MIIPIAITALVTLLVTAPLVAWLTRRHLQSGELARIERRAIALELSRDVAEKEKILDHVREQLITIVGHELRTPVQLMLGYIDVLMYGQFGDLDPVVIDQLGVVNNSARRIYFLVRRVVALMRKAANDKQLLDVDVGDLADKVLAADDLFVITRRQPGDVAIQIDCPKPVTFRLDRESLYIMLFELIHNSIKFKAENVLVTINNGDELSIAVKDDGIGIERKHHLRIFDLGVQVDMSDRRSFEGTGTGLYVLKELLEWHGGWVELISEPGKGSTFTLRFPLDEQARVLNRMKDKRALVG